MLENLFQFGRRFIRHDRLILAGLLLLALAVRGGVLWAMRGNLQQDPDAYREIAENLLRHGEFALGKPGIVESTSPPVPTAYRPPLYPIVLSNLPTRNRQEVSLTKVAALHLALGLATVWLTWLTARRLCDSSAGDAGVLATDETQMKHRWSLSVPICVSSVAPLLAGLIVACDPILLNQQTLVMTETLAAFLAILSLWSLVRFTAAPTAFNAALAGGSIGLAVLCRPTFLPWLGMVSLLMLVVGARNSEFRMQNAEFRMGNVGWRWWRGLGWRFVNVAGLVVGAAAVLSPWAIRNYQVFGKPILTTTHGGYTLWLGNNEFFYDWLIHSSRDVPWSVDLIDLDHAPPRGSLNFRFSHLFETAMVPQVLIETAPQSELAIDRKEYEMASNTIRARPFAFVRACFYRVCQLWSPLPHKLTADESTPRRLLRYATCLWYCGDYLLAAVGVWKLRWKLIRPPWLWGVLLCLAFTAVHTVYWTNLRMRAPLMPVIALVAAAAVLSLPRRQPAACPLPAAIAR